MTAYSDKLKDPRWQKKRLEILERDNWTCKSCSTTEKTLNIHHLFYLKNIDPWDMPSGFLVTLCEDCHKEESERNGCDNESLLFDISAVLNFYFMAGFNFPDFINFAEALYKIKRIPGLIDNIKISQVEFKSKGKK